MLKEKVYRLQIGEHESSCIFFNTRITVNLITSKFFEILNPSVIGECIQKVFSNNGIELNLIQQNGFTDKELLQIIPPSALTVVLLDGFSPDFFTAYNSLINSDLPVLGITSKKNSTFFEDLKKLNIDSSQLDAKNKSNNSRIQEALKVLAEGILSRSSHYTEYDFSGFAENPADFVELLKNKIDVNNSEKKEFYSIADKLSEEQNADQLCDILYGFSENPELIDAENVAKLCSEFQNLDDSLKKKSYIVFSPLIRIFLDRVSSGQISSDELSALEYISEKLIERYKELELTSGDLKNLADSQLVIACNSANKELYSSAREIYQYLLEKIKDEEVKQFRYLINNNLCIALISEDVQSNHPESLEHVISTLDESFEPAFENQNINVFGMFNSALASIRIADLIEDPEHYHKAVDKLENILSGQPGPLLDEKNLLLRLSYVYRRIGEIEKNKEALLKSGGLNERLSEEFKGLGENERYTDVLRDTAGTYVLLSEIESSPDYIEKAGEKLRESLSNLQSNSDYKKQLEIRTLLADLLLNTPLAGNDSSKIREAITYYEDAAHFIKSEENRVLHADIYKKIGDAYRFAGEMEKDSESCFRAIESYEQCLNYYNNDDFPPDFAKIQKNIGSCYEMLSNLELEALYSRKAVECYNNALSIYDEDSSPEDYYTVINNLGNAFSSLSEFENLEENCTKAIEYYKTSSRFYTIDKFPLAYAMNQNNLGVACSALAVETESRDFFYEAVSAFSDALEVYTLGEHPEKYAMIQNNLGDSYYDLSCFEDKPLELLKKSIECFENSKKVFETENNPSKFGFITRKLAKIYKKLYFLDRSPEILNSSIRSNLESLEYFKYDLFPEEYALIQIELGILFGSDIKDGTDTDKINRAIESYKNACRYFKREDYPVQYSKISSNLGNLYRALSFTNNKKENALESVKVLSSAADAIETGSSDKFHAIILNNLGSSYCVLSDVMEPEANLLKACETFAASLELLSENEHEIISIVRNNLANARISLFELTGERNYIDTAAEDYLSAMDNTPHGSEDNFISILKNNYASSRLLISETLEPQEGESKDFIFQNYSEALENVSADSNPVVYSAIKNNIACWYIDKFYSDTEDRILDDAGSSLSESREICDSQVKSFPCYNLKNNEGVIDLLRYSFSSDTEELQKAKGKFSELYNYKDTEKRLVSEILKVKSQKNLLNTLKLLNNVDPESGATDDFFNLLSNSLGRFNVVANPEVFASLNYNLGGLNKKIAIEKNDETFLKNALKNYQKCLDVYSGENYKLQSALVNLEIGSAGLLYFRKYNNSEYLDDSVNALKNSLEVINADEFPNKNAEVNLTLADLLFESGKSESDTDKIFEAIKYFDFAQSHFDSEKDDEIGEKLSSAYSLLTNTDISFENTEQGIQYYGNLLDVFKSGESTQYATTVKIKLAELYYQSYKTTRSIEHLQSADNTISEVISVINKDSSEETYFNALALGAETSLILGTDTGDPELLNTTVARTKECLDYYSSDKDSSRYSALCKQTADSCLRLYEITDVKDELSHSVYYFKEALRFAEKQSGDFDKLEKSYLSSARKLATLYFEDSEFEEVLKLSEELNESLSVNPDKEIIAEIHYLAGKSAIRICEDNFSEDLLKGGVNNLTNVAGYFRSETKPEKYFDIKSEILSGYKTLFSNSENYDYLDDSLDVIENLISYCRSAGRDEECIKFLLDKADCTYLKAKNEYASGNPEIAIDLCRHSLEFFSPEEFAAEYAHINQLVGMSYLSIESTGQSVENAGHAIKHLNLAKNYFSTVDTGFEENIVDINQNLEKAYRTVLSEDTQQTTHNRIESLEKLLAVYSENENYDKLSITYMDLAQAYIESGRLNKDENALRKGLKNLEHFNSYLDDKKDSLKIAESSNLIAEICLDIFEISGEKQTLADAIENYERSRDIYSEQSYEARVSELDSVLFQSYCRYGNIYENEKDLETALIFYEKAVDSGSDSELVEEKNSRRTQNAMLYCSLGETNGSSEAFEKGLLVLKDCINKVESNDEKSGTCVKTGEIFEKFYTISKDNEKLESAIRYYKEASGFLSENDEFKNEINSRIARLLLQTAESYYNGKSGIAVEKYIESLNYFTIENSPEKHAEINVKLADFAIEKFESSHSPPDGEEAINYLNSATAVYSPEEKPEKYEAIKSKIKQVFDTFIEHDLLDSGEKEQCLLRLREIALNLDNKNEVARYNKELALLYMDDSYSGDYDFESFINDLKDSEDYTASENQELSCEIQYIIIKLLADKTSAEDSFSLLADAEKYLQKFIENPGNTADIKTLDEVKKSIFDLNIQYAGFLSENGRSGDSIQNYKEILERYGDAFEKSANLEIKITLGEMFYEKYRNEGEKHLLKETLSFYRSARNYFEENRLQKEAETTGNKLDEIFVFVLESATSLTPSENIQNLEELFELYPEDNFNRQFTEIKRKLGLSFIEMFKISEDSDNLFRAEKILDEVLAYCKDEYPEEYLADLNMNLGEINLLIFNKTGEQFKAEISREYFQTVVSLSDDEQKLNAVELKLNDISRRTEASTETDDSVIVEEEQEEVIDLQENAAVREAVDENENEEVLSFTDEELIDEEKVHENLTENNTLNVETETKEVNFVMKEENESIEADFMQTYQVSEPPHIKELKEQIESDENDLSPENQIELLIRIAEAYKEEVDSGNTSNANYLAFENLKKAISIAKKDVFPGLHANISMEMVSISKLISSDLDLREFKQLISHGKNALDYYTALDYASEYARLNKDIGIIHTLLAEREGELKYYKNSINYYNEALKLINKEENTEDFAVINKNLGISYGIISEIEFDEKAFQNSLKCYENAIHNLDEDEQPDEFALVNKYLGIAYGTYGERNSDIEHIEKSTRCYEKALRYFSAEDSDYSLLNRNLGNNYLKLIETNNDPEFCKSGIEAYTKALDFYENDKTPFVYASINNNIGSLYSALSDIEDKIENSKKAIESYSKVLKVYNINDNPMEFAAANNNLGIAYRNLAEVSDKAENCEKAIGCYEKALKAYTLKDFPIQYSNMQNNLGTAYRTLAEEKDKITNCKKAIKCYEEALKVRTIENMPIQFAGTQNNLGVAYRSLAEMESKNANSKKAIKAYEAALFVYTFDKYPIQYATTKNNLAGAYSTLAESEDREKNYNNSIESYREAQKVFSENDFPDIYNMIEDNIVYLQNNVEQ